MPIKVKSEQWLKKRELKLVREKFINETIYVLYDKHDNICCYGCAAVRCNRSYGWINALLMIDDEKMYVNLCTNCY